MAGESDATTAVVDQIRRFVKRDVLPVAREMELADEYPEALVETMASLGLFGAFIPEEYGGSGLSFSTYARIVEELSVGWMSLSGVINSHLMMAYLVWQNGTEDQRQQFLPRMASGELRGGLALTESDAGSDTQAIRTTAVRDGDDYVVNGSKMFVTNGIRGNIFALVAKTDPEADPPYRGISLFLAEKGPGFQVGRKLHKLGYRGVDTTEFAFHDYRIPADRRIGEEGAGFRYVMSGLEVGRINVAARAVGLARAAFEDSIRYAQQRHTFGKPISEHQAIQFKLADMGTKIEASRLMVRSAAEKKDRGERCDLEAGMAKLFATEACQEITLEAIRIHGGYGYVNDLPVERYYRDAPLLIVGEGTNEIQRLVIARQLLKEYAV
jgi:alkylation response protein AidB-like acyl-CoA dehydrogenase